MRLFLEHAAEPIGRTRGEPETGKNLRERERRETEREKWGEERWGGETKRKRKKGREEKGALPSVTENEEAFDGWFRRALARGCDVPRARLVSSTFPVSLGL